MALLSNLWGAAKKLRSGRRSNAPARDTLSFPLLQLLGQTQNSRRQLYKPTPRNLRYFGKTPYARRAMNAIKNPVAHLKWEVVPAAGVEVNGEIRRQIAAVTRSLERPNGDDSFRTLVEQVLEDVMHGAGAIEQQVGGDPERPLWLWPVDGLSIQIFPGWTGDASEARYVQGLGYGAVGGGVEARMLRNDELIYIRPNPSTATPFGLGPLEVAFSSISRQLGVGEYAGNISTNATPPVIINLGKSADKGAVDAFRSYWTTDIEGQGKTPIIGSEDPSVLRLYPEGDAALYLAYQEFLIREIATAFDLPAQELGIEKNVNKATSQVADDRKWDTAVRPYASLIEEYINREAIQGRLGFSQIRFRYIGLDREDEQAAADVFETRYKNNAITPEEYRKQIGLTPSDSPWATMTYADVQIAIAQARGAKAPDATEQDGAELAPLDKPKSKKKD